MSEAGETTKSWKFVRRRFSISNFRLQMKIGLLFLFALLLCVSTIVGLYVLYVDRLMAGLQDLGFSPDLLVTTVSMRETGGLLVQLGAVLAGLLIVLFIVVVVYANRMTGPIYNLNNQLTRMLAPDFSLSVQFRKHDAFKTLEYNINEFLELIRRINQSEVAELNGVIEMIESDADRDDLLEKLNVLVNQKLERTHPRQRIDS